MAPDNDPPPPPPPPDSATKGANVDKAAGISTAKGNDTSALGDQVHPDTQTSEADGHRTLVKPVTDPGPAKLPGGVNIAHPDRTKGQQHYGDANEPLPIMRRVSTGHGDGYGKPAGEMIEMGKMAPDLAISGAASECYHPSDGKETSLTADAEAKAAQAKEAAPVHE